MTPFSQYFQQNIQRPSMGRMPFTGGQQYTGLQTNPQQTLQNLFRLLGLYKASMSQQQPGRSQTRPISGMPTPQQVEAARQKWLQQNKPVSATNGPRY